MKKLILFVILASLLGCFCCNSEKVKDSNFDIQNNIELSIESGENWQGKMRVFIFSVKKTPQLAAWIEDNEGNYVSTITVTNRSAKKSWRSAPKEGRPETLPVWNHKHQTGDIDAVSSATPKGSVEAIIDKGSLIDGNTYHVYLEINHSFDYNNYWTENNSGINGQPSLVYHARFTAGQPGSIALVPIGHGSVDGSDGNITMGLEGFTTALSIVKGVYIRF